MKEKLCLWTFSTVTRAVLCINSNRHLSSLTTTISVQKHKTCITSGGEYLEDVEVLIQILLCLIKYETGNQSTSDFHVHYFHEHLICTLSFENLVCTQNTEVLHRELFVMNNLFSFVTLAASLKYFKKTLSLPL